jgi:hypothetical protein
MTWRERISALLFGKVWLYVHSGLTQPPVALQSMRDIFPELPKAKLISIKRLSQPSKFAYYRLANASQVYLWLFEIIWRMPWLEEPKKVHYQTNYGAK